MKIVWASLSAHRVMMCQAFVFVSNRAKEPANMHCQAWREVSSPLAGETPDVTEKCSCTDGPIKFPGWPSTTESRGLCFDWSLNDPRILDSALRRTQRTRPGTQPSARIAGIFTSRLWWGRLEVRCHTALGSTHCCAYHQLCPHEAFIALSILVMSDPFNVAVVSAPAIMGHATLSRFPTLTGRSASQRPINVELLPLPMPVLAPMQGRSGWHNAEDTLNTLDHA